MNFQFPAVYTVNKKWKKSSIQQLTQPQIWMEVATQPYRSGRIKGFVLTPIAPLSDPILAVENNIQALPQFNKILQIRPESLLNGNDWSIEGTKAKWIHHPGQQSIPTSLAEYIDIIENTQQSWKHTFRYEAQEDSESTIGLRPPQLGAIHAIHAHWVVSHEPATIVMPTGTGKTETMLSVLVSKQCSRLLVIVPTDALRIQIAGKFLSLGILKDCSVISDQALYPIVGVLKDRPQTLEEIDDFFEKCHVIVTTMSVAGMCSDEIQTRMAYHCSHLFIDEAHHIGAKTWRGLKEKFSSRHILQFTATPFRNDGRRVDGKIIFKYSLKQAQDDGYFRPINFKPIIEYNPSKVDLVIAEKAVTQLRGDLQRYNHILMARVDTVERAKEVFSIYEQYKEFNPVQIHTGISSVTEREQIRKQILSGRSKIVICVDMLGEGFDLPELKIAAFHDIRKSLAVTLQVAGRFTRTRADLGDPTFIANVADVNVGSELQKLYWQDADWNTLLRQSSDNVIQTQLDLHEFMEGFQNFPDQISLSNLRPAMSTVVYRTKCQDWKPEDYRRGLAGADQMDQILHDIHPEENVLVIITAQRLPVDWSPTQEIVNLHWDLYILFWDHTQNLLFIHGAGNSGHYEQLAQSVAGVDAELFKGPLIFRCFAGINRLQFQNVGLIEQLGRLIRYTMRAGADIEPGLTQAQKENTTKANIFGDGYTNGEDISIGCSYKGRIWSRKTDNLKNWTDWCRGVGAKLLDEAIDPEEVLRGTLIQQIVSTRPQKMPVGIEWHEEIYMASETSIEFVFDDSSVVSLFEVDLKLVNPSESGDLIFELASEDRQVTLRLSFSDTRGYLYSIIGDDFVFVKRGRNTTPVEEFFYSFPPRIWFADGSWLIGNEIIELRNRYPLFPIEELVIWDWTGTNIKKESQGVEKNVESIQYRVIQELKTQDYEIIFDDDNPGEAADVVAIISTDKEITVELYHCKFSGDNHPGARVTDLYAVCCQAQTSVYWAIKSSALFDHMGRRESQRLEKPAASRFERGSIESILTLKNKSSQLKVQFKVYIVQPGVSKARVSDDQLQLLSITANYLKETRMLPFTVIISA